MFFQNSAQNKTTVSSRLKARICCVFMSTILGTCSAIADSSTASRLLVVFQQPKNVGFVSSLLLDPKCHV